MELTENQIQELYKFTRKHFVEFYDVQTELVDHLANDIEQIWQEKPQLSFEQARDISFRKFGVFGFMDVISSKQKALSKKYLKILWSFTKEWFRLPKIILTLFIFFFTYQILQFRIGFYIICTLIFLLMIVEGYIAFKLRKKSKERFKNQKKKWMLEDMIFNTATNNMFFMLYIIFDILNIFNNTTSVLGSLLFSLIITITILFSYVTLIVIPEKAEELLIEEYPEYKLSQ